MKKFSLLILLIGCLFMFAGCQARTQANIRPGGFLSELEYKELQSTVEGTEIKINTSMNVFDKLKRGELPSPRWAYYTKEPLYISESTPITLRKITFHNDDEEKIAKILLKKVDKNKRLKRDGIYRVQKDTTFDIEGLELVGSITAFRSCNYFKSFMVGEGTFLQVEFKILDHKKGGKNIGVIQMNSSKICGGILGLADTYYIDNVLLDIYKSMKKNISKDSGKSYGYVFPPSENIELTEQ